MDDLTLLVLIDYCLSCFFMKGMEENADDKKEGTKMVERNMGVMIEDVLVNDDEKVMVK